MHKFIFATLWVVFAFVFFCGTPKGGSKRKKKKSSVAVLSQPLKGEYRIVSINMGERLDSLKENQAFLGFDTAGLLYGNTGCNNFTGNYRQTGDSLSIEVLGMTKMYCRGEAGKTEYRFNEMSPQIKKVRKLNATDYLLSGDMGEIMLLRKL